MASGNLSQQFQPTASGPKTGGILGYGRQVSSSLTLMQGLGKSTIINLQTVLAKRSAQEIQNRRTKIICTMGPSCWTVDKLCELIDQGMNVARLNFSHGDHETHARTVQNIHEALKKRPGKTVALLLDTKGPEIRTGLLKDGKAIELVPHQKLKLVTDYKFVGDNTTIACSYSKLPQSVQPGNVILLADGSVSCTVIECGPDYVITEVQNGAKLGERKNMNLPNVKVDLPVVGDKDKDDILNFGIPQGISFIAASFVQHAENVREIRNLLGPRGRHIKIISKIENVEGLLNFDEILRETDGIMVARGDLGMEIPPEKVFLAQKMMIAKCNVVGKPVVTATQMLESMIKNPRPTRAEVTDVANAVLDGTDCVMLSGETANGDFPADAVRIMSKTCVESESCLDYNSLFRAIHAAVPRPVSTQEAVACAAVETAEDVNAALIVALTETGYTARMITKYRPPQLILALSASESTVKHLQVHRGVIALQVPSFQGTDHVIRNALEAAKEMNLVKPGDNVVAVHGMKEEVAGASNIMKVVEVQ